MKLLVDMNLSPSWIERLADHGFEAVHWSSVGAATAPDSEILTWATEHGFVLITNDLDFKRSSRPMHVAIVRRDSAMPMPLSSAPPFRRPLRARFIAAVAASDRFCRERAFI